MISFDVAGKVSRGEGKRGILIGGVGIGMVIAANKLPEFAPFSVTTRLQLKSAVGIATATSYAFPLILLRKR